MSGVALELVVIFLLLVANGVFALSEIAIISARKARLQQRAEQGDAGARAALDLAGEPGRFLSAVQIGITLVGIFTGAFGGATLTEKLSAQLKEVAFLAPYRDSLSLGIVVLGITYFSLVIGELAPKRLALTNPEGFAIRMARPMQVLSRITSPIVYLLDASTAFLMRLFGIQPHAESPVSEDEIRILIRQGTAAGVFDPAEQEIVERVFHVGDLRVESIMVPRVDMESLDLEDPPESNRRKLAEHGHSFYPVHRGNPDRILGVIKTRELMPLCMAGKPLDFETLAFKPLVVPESMRVLKLLELFKQRGQTVAVVIDEYGGTQGLVTSTDVLQAIAGEMPTEGEEEAFVRREDGSWLVDGSASLGELEEKFGSRALTDAIHGGTFVTLGGLVLSQLGRVPSPGDCFTLGGYRFEVVDLDGNRVDKILVTPLQRVEGGGSEDSP
ncbi:MAG: hemolysin family protein [Armatimonadetes bacterium]|nr:hemolysin family protein [Armatimonadota bacterium]